jgi:hypothetical protein
MALDYRTLQAIAASESRDADGFCPECGQPIDRVIPSGCRRATSRSRWHWIVAALGLYLAVAFGLEGWSAQRLAALRFEDLRQAAAWCTHPSGVDPRCADLAAARGLDSVLARLARYGAAEREAQRDLAVAAVGLLTTLAGIAAVTRPLPYGSRGERSQSCVRKLRPARDALAVGANAMVPCAQLLLAASGFLVIARLLRGTSPSAEMVAGSVHRAIELVVAVAQNA